MTTPIIMPKFGQMTEVSDIVQWLKKEGDPVAKGDILFTVETDKSVMEVESFEAGTLLKIIVPAGISVPVQSTVGFLGQPGEAIPAVPAPVPLAPKPAAPPATPAPAAKTAAIVSAAPVAAAAVPADVAAQALFRISPRAAALARRCGIDPNPIHGSGPEGRIVERDVKKYLKSCGYEKLRVSAAARELAAQEEVDLLSVRPDDDGRITVAGVRRAVAEKPRPMSKMRQIIAQRLTQSVTTQPHFYVTVSVDVTDLIAWRNELKAAGAPYTVTDFISQAVVLCLEEFPVVNSSTDGRTTRWHSQVNLGLAVSVEGGLVVPVIRNAGQLTLAEISAAARELADKARAGKLAPDEMSGGTFTISNMGMLDVENFSAIINPGEGAILAVASALPQPAVRNGQIVVRQMMKMTLSADHRLVDGALGARFINAVKARLEDIELWKRLTS
jgi:pyruvate dehydrogenase E2 component (dihydrolipoamide acetyltransferase)